MGEGTSTRSSPGNTVSDPPLKKKVTWAYFSVSAIRSWVMPIWLRYSPRPFWTVTRGKATSTLGMEASYSVLHTKVTGKNWRVNPSKSGSTRVRVISRARSGRKLKKITLSLSEMVPSLSQTTGSTNSSVTPRS